MPACGAEAIVERDDGEWRVITYDGTTGAVTFVGTREAAESMARDWLTTHQPGRLIVRDAWAESEETWPASGG